MPDTAPVITLSPRDYDAILFDLDGVLTKTARGNGQSLDVRLTRESLMVRGRDRGPAPIRLGCKNEVYEFSDGRRAFTLE